MKPILSMFVLMTLVSSAGPGRSQDLLGLPAPSEADFGVGTNEDGTQYFASPFAFDPRDVTNTSPTYVTGEKTLTVQNSTELRKAMALSVSASARMGWGSFSADANYHSSTEFSSSRFYYMSYWYKAAAQFTDVTRSQPELLELTETALEFLTRKLPERDGGVADPDDPGTFYDPQNILEFYRHYGTHFWSKAQFGILYSLVYEFGSDETATREDFGGSMGYENVNMEFTGEFSSEYGAHSQNSTVDVSRNVWGIPDDGSRPAELDFGKYDPPSVRQNQAILEGCQLLLPIRFGAPVRYSSIVREVARAEYRYEQRHPLPSFEAAKRNEALELLRLAYERNAYAAADRRRRITLSTLVPPVIKYSADARATMQAQRRMLEDQNNEITHRARSCMETERRPDLAFDPSVCGLQGLEDLTDLELPPCDQPFCDTGSATLGLWNIEPMNLHYYPSWGMAWHNAYNFQIIRLLEGGDPVIRAVNMRDEIAAYASTNLPCCGHPEGPEWTPLKAFIKDPRWPVGGLGRGKYIGSMDVVSDRGVDRPSLLLGPNSSLGVMRIVEEEAEGRPYGLLEDGLPSVVLEFIFFDKLGFIEMVNGWPAILQYRNASAAGYRVHIELPAAPNVADIQVPIGQSAERRFRVVNTGGGGWRLAVVGAIPGFQFTYADGAGSGEIVMAGRAAEPGVWDLKLQLYNIGNGRIYDERPLRVHFVDGLRMETEALPLARVGRRYRVTIAASGGVAPYQFAGSGLPSGVVLDATGTVWGRPLSAGLYRVTATCTDATGAATSVNLDMTVAGSTQIERLDLNSDGSSDVADVIRYLRYLFLGGVPPAPLSCWAEE